jgi:inosine-uridine nucleoside N-ribohydrolase
MLLSPDFAAKLGELIVMGGSFAFGPFARRGEFNLRSDPKAAEIVLSSPIRKTLISMDLCSHVVFGKRELAALEANGGGLQTWLADRLRTWRLLNAVLFRSGGFFPWDVVAATRAIEPSLFTTRPLLFKTRTEGSRRGSIFDVTELESFETRNGTVPIDVPDHFETKRFMEMFLESLLSF